MFLTAKIYKFLLISKFLDIKKAILLKYRLSYLVVLGIMP